MKKIAVLIILGVVFLSLAFGQVPPALSAPTEITNKPLTTVHELTAADVETFLDGIVPLQLDREDIAGATVAVVKDEKLLLTKGYGYADVKRKQPVAANAMAYGFLDESRNGQRIIGHGGDAANFTTADYDFSARRTVGK